MITSNMARAGHPSRVIVRIGSEAARGCGLLMDSVIMIDNLATILDSEIDRVIGTFRELTEIDAALRTTLAL
jgi:mRNA interferase MazF